MQAGHASKAGAASKLARVVQLTGLSDALYAEAYVTVHQYDISLDVSVINRTNDTMQVPLRVCCSGPPSTAAAVQHVAVLPSFAVGAGAIIAVGSWGMQNVTLELATMGDLRLVERPQAHTLAPGAQKAIRANIKVSSTETGAIFGNLVYESTGYADRRCGISALVAVAPAEAAAL